MLYAESDDALPFDSLIAVENVVVSKQVMKTLTLDDVWFAEFFNPADIKYVEPAKTKRKIASVSGSDCVALCNYGISEGKASWEVKNVVDSPGDERRCGQFSVHTFLIM
jgi:hypothetical protein